ncbi:hypothetical protein J1N35_004439 [Gossypium stocksii]|uniref:Uncharacterized protein n=1 Tax=Gossypium stocksii TaxID=47602 RepID=A0A9D4AHN7_9ROSI|nr:hypothetical protein J1N35_004439 [Gossypium stocksii]
MEGAKKRNNFKKEDNFGSRFNTLVDLEESSLEQVSVKIPQSVMENKGKEVLMDSDINVHAGLENEPTVSIIVPAESSKTNRAQGNESSGLQQENQLLKKLETINLKENIEANIFKDSCNVLCSMTLANDNSRPSSTGQDQRDYDSSSFKQSDHVVLFNPVFEENSFVNVEMKEGVLEARNHSTGCGSGKFLRAFREYNTQHKPDIVSLLEPSISGVKADLTIAKMGWDKSHHVEAISFSGGI